MTKDQRAKLVGLIFEYGNAVGAAALAGSDVDGRAERTSAAILALLDEMTTAEPTAVAIVGRRS